MYALPRPARSSFTANCASACFFKYSSRSLRSLGAEPAIKSRISTSPLAFSSGPWITAQGTAALVGIFELLADAVLGIAEIEFGADAGVAKLGGERLAGLHAVGAEHRDQHGAGGRLLAELAERGERRLQARDADGEAGRRHRLAHEARHETVVAPAAADRAETHRAAFVVLDLEGEFNFVDGTGVIFEPADDGLIDANALAVSSRIHKFDSISASSWCPAFRQRPSRIAIVLRLADVCN